MGVYLENVMESQKCRYCHKTYTDDVDVNYIKQTGICICCEDMQDERATDKWVKEEDFDELFIGLSKVDSSKLVVRSPSSGMNVESLRLVYKK